MSFRRLHAYLKSPGKSTLGFRDIEPFLDRERMKSFHECFLLLFRIIDEKDKERRAGLQAELSSKMPGAGMFLNHLIRQPCILLDTKKLEVAGVPFQVYFSPFPSRETVAGAYMADKSLAVLSLSCAVSFLTSFVAFSDAGLVAFLQNTPDIEKFRIFANLKAKGKEGFADTAQLFTGIRLFADDLDRFFQKDSNEEYMKLVELVLNNYAIHEAAHVLHGSAGILGKPDAVKEEERAHLSEFAFGNPGLTMPFLPKSDNGRPNSLAAKSMICRIFERCGMYDFLSLDAARLSAVAKELLDADFLSEFGRHHDQMIPADEINKVKNHRFLGGGLLPMMESLRCLPVRKDKADDEKDRKEKKAA